MTEPPAASRTARDPARRRAGVVASLALVGLLVALIAASGWLRAPGASAPAQQGAAVAPVDKPPAVQPAYNPAADHFILHQTPAPVPDLAFVGGDGQAHSLSGFRGRPIVLNLWATWCVPCRWEMPSLDRLQGRFSPADLLVVALAASDPAGVRKFYGELGLGALGIYTSPAGGDIVKLGLPGYPGTLLIDADGNEIARKLGPTEWDRPEIVDLLVQRFGLPAPGPTSGSTP